MLYSMLQHTNTSHSVCRLVCPFFLSEWVSGFQFERWDCFWRPTCFRVEHFQLVVGGGELGSFFHICNLLSVFVAATASSVAAVILLHEVIVFLWVKCFWNCCLRLPWGKVAGWTMLSVEGLSHSGGCCELRYYFVVGNWFCPSKNKNSNDN